MLHGVSVGILQHKLAHVDLLRDAMEGHIHGPLQGKFAHVEIEGKHIARPAGQESEGDVAAAQLFGHLPHRAVAAGGHDDLRAGRQGPPRGIAPSVFRGGLQPEGRAKPRRECYRGDGALQFIPSDLRRVVDDCGDCSLVGGHSDTLPATPLK